MPEDTDTQDSQPQSSPSQPSSPPPPPAESIPVPTDWKVDISQRKEYRPPPPEPEFTEID
jgi:hypothetical protein